MTGRARVVLAALAVVGLVAAVALGTNILANGLAGKGEMGNGRPPAWAADE